MVVVVFILILLALLALAWQRAAPRDALHAVAVLPPVERSQWAHWVFGHQRWMSPLRSPHATCRLLQPFVSSDELEKNHDLLVFQDYLGEKRYVALSSDALRAIMVGEEHCYVKPDVTRKLLQLAMGEKGLLLLEAPAHARRRGEMVPAFRRDALFAKSDAMFRIVHDELELLVPDAKAVDVEVQPLMSRITLRIMSAVVGLDYTEKAWLDLLDSYGKFLDGRELPHWMLILVAIVPAWMTPWLPFARIRESMRLVERIRNVVVAAATATEHQTQSDDEAAPNDDSVLGILQKLLHEGSMTSAEALDHMLTFLAAGHATTASGISWALFEMAGSPRRCARLREEIGPAFLEGDCAKRAAWLDTCPFLAAVVQETLRVYPPINWTARKVCKEHTLCGVRMARNAIVGIPILALQRHASTWTQRPGDDETACFAAHVFEPERHWLSAVPGQPARAASAELNAFLPFLSGARGCVGARLALLEMKVVLSTLIQHCDVRLTAASEPRMMGAVSTAHGLRVTLCRRPPL
ncbi:11-oxo-beta-amyrin 30-oxidase [Porphyridium purpureum]|uniref:11-oxo-beta-amyrin 30-oxidase n=1 Tax=Porphyridium purpureum TaxID=35688 RepID=A0A5J4YME6_PORPP|nr:11-oxo-beta-amyrin 30-oxidase [Porphyridium purpureum]|eukprot:POR6489..scf295_9